jgi:excisionase family DNA binding protein
MSFVRKFLSTSEVAKLFHVHYSSVTRWCHDGLLPFETTPGGHFRIPSDASLIQSRMGGATANG